MERIHHKMEFVREGELVEEDEVVVEIFQRIKMPRPRLRRHLQFDPEVTFYKPNGIPLKQLKIMELTHEEWESLRLKNVEELSQIQAAEEMNTSQSTFQRIYTSAQKKVSTAIISGMAIKIAK